MNFKEKIVRLCILFIFVLTSQISASAKESSTFNWQPVIDAIIEVESNGDTRAKSGNSVGAMQITPILVAECNNILRSRNQKRRYKLSDRFSLQKSKEMFLLMQSQFNQENNVEKAIRAWNGGNNFSKKRTQRYFEKVMCVLKSND